MNDFDRYSKEFYLATKKFSLRNVLKCYQLPKSIELHNMICNSKDYFAVEEKILFDTSEAIDFFEYEKELWNLERRN